MKTPPAQEGISGRSHGVALGILLLVVATLAVWAVFSDPGDGPAPGPTTTPGVLPGGSGPAAAELPAQVEPDRRETGAGAAPAEAQQPARDATPAEGMVSLDQAPVADAMVILHEDEKLLRATTDAEGRFAFPGPPPRLAFVEVESDAATHARRHGSWEWPLQIGLQRRRELTVMVVDTLGRPLPGAEVLLWKFPADRVRSAMPAELELLEAGESGADGSFLFRDLPARDLMVEARKPGYVGLSDDIDFNTASGQGPAGLDLELRKARAQQLRVFAPDGGPLAGARVLVANRLLWRESLTGPDGSFVPDPTWEPDPPDQPPPYSPRVFVVLPNGRVWSSLAGPSPRPVDEGWVFPTADQEVTAELRGSVPEGAWVEARRLPGKHDPRKQGRHSNPAPAGLQHFPWTRLQPGTPVSLDEGWTGERLGVEAWLQPAALPLGYFPVEDGGVQVQLGELGVLEAKLILPLDAEPGSWEISCVSRRAGTQSARIPVDAHGVARVVLPRDDYSLLLYPPLGPLRRGSGELAPAHFRLESSRHTLEIRLVENRAVGIAVRMNGLPVRGGSIDRFPIGRDGRARVDLPGDRAARVDLLELLPPRKILELPGGPVACSWIPGPVVRPGDAPLELDLWLSPVVMHLDPTVLESRTVRLTVLGGPAGAAPTSRGEGWEMPLDASVFRVEPGQARFDFRVPAGRYRIRVGARFLGPGEGVEALPGIPLILEER